MFSRIHTALSVTTIFISAVVCNGQSKSEWRPSYMPSDRVSAAWNAYATSLQKTFETKRVAWPPADVFIRAFKSQNQLELWARSDHDAPYSKIKTYQICAMSGSLGPKRKQGDRQVPEGFYFIEEFNPHSDYHLSLKISYPNYSDEHFCDKKTGGQIYIHGGCLTVGCLPMTDKGIAELYTACWAAHTNGQQFIPVHIFPNRMHQKGVAYLEEQFATNAEKKEFWNGLKRGYEYFEEHHQLLPVAYTPDGRYVN